MRVSLHRVESGSNVKSFTWNKYPNQKQKNIQDHYWKLDNKCFHLGPRLMGFHALLCEIQALKVLTQAIFSLLYNTLYSSSGAAGAALPVPTDFLVVYHSSKIQNLC